MTRSRAIGSVPNQLMAEYMRRLLGVNGVDSLSRIMGFLLVCIGIQFIVNGVTDLI